MKNLSIFLMILFSTVQVSICMNLFLSKKQQLFKAIENNDLTTVEKLVTKNPELIKSEKDGCTPLHRAVRIRRGNESLVTLLLSKGANIEAQDYHGMSPLHIAVFRKNKSLITLLLDKGANIEAQDVNGYTPLHSAAARNDESLDIWWLLSNESLVTLLLRKKANIEAQDNGGDTPLHVAVDWKNESLVRLLLDEGANIEAQDKYGKTPLHWAVEKGNKSLVRLLLDKGANMEVQDNKVKTPIRHAQESGYQNIFNLVKQKQLSGSVSLMSTSTSAQKNAPMFGDVIELSPMHQAVQENNYSKVQELIVQGADINQQTASGVSALMLACTFGYIDIVRFLLDRGVDNDLKDDKGKTAFDCARNNNRQAVMKLLRERAQYATTSSKSSSVFVYGQITSQGVSSSTPQYAGLKLFPTEGSTSKY